MQSPEELPVICQEFPYMVQLEAGKKYFWCACGLSKNQPFCDGSHKGTEMNCKLVEVEETKNYALCGCKHAKKGGPFCDGGHNSL